ncbi:MAG: hypothetical protein NZ894_05815 [Archaeoglobaceae archaeon]|nr:hypothetical protein [Archaeoglobaceae archaeon]
MVNNVISAILLTAVFFTFFAVGVEIVTEGMKILRVIEDSRKVEEVFEKIERLENDSFSFRVFNGVFLIFSNQISIEYCGISENMQSYKICYVSDFRKCTEIYPRVNLEHSENLTTLSILKMELIFDILNKPGEHKLKIEHFETKKPTISLFKTKKSISDSKLNISAEINSEKLFCEENLILDVVYGEHNERRFVAIFKAEDYLFLKDSMDIESIRETAKWYAELIGNGSVRFKINTDKWVPGYYKVLFTTQTLRNDEMTFLILGNVSIDFQFAKQNFWGVGKILFTEKKVIIYDEDWHS